MCVRGRGSGDSATGAVTGHITSNTWYDSSGRPIKEKPGGSERFQKTVYDGLGRPVKTFVGYDVDETTYDDATSVTGDTIFQQDETEYSEAGSVIQTISRQRIHNASGTGELQDPSTEPRARVTYLCAWHDGSGRQIATANYGTNGGEPFTRSHTVPDPSDTVLVTTTEYNARGEAYATIDPMGHEDRTTLDDAGRTVETVENFKVAPARPDQSKTTRMTFSPDGQQATLTAVNPTTGDQTTRYVYGTTLAESHVARSDLLRMEIYPDSDDTAHDDGDDQTYDRVEYTYNAQGERKSLKDQNGTLRGFVYDKLGRQIHDYVDTLGAGVDGQVRRLSRSYGLGGRLHKITSYTHPFAKTGSIVNEVLFDYNEFGLPSAEYQSHSGAVDVVSMPKVQYAYDDTLASGELVKGLRPTQLIYPNGRIVRYEYAEETSSSGAGDDPDDLLNRIKFIADDDEGAVGTHLAQYTYLGLGAIVTEAYPEPQVKLDYTFDTYAGFDRFGRIVDQRWQNYASGADLDRYQYGHDRAGNRTYRRNLTTTERDEFYTYDGLHRLVRADRANLDATKTRIAGTPELQETWSLDSTGNWSAYTQREVGKTLLNQQRAHNPVNELTGISASIGDTWANPGHDPNGNMTVIPKPSDASATFTLRWDAWNRLVKVSDVAGLVAEYQYDARNYRVAKRVYRDPSDPLSALGSPLSTHYYHNNRWQVLEERESSSPVPSPATLAPHAHYVWSLRYIDAPIVRDRNTAADTVSLNERLYYLGDANFNVMALIDTTGQPVERYAYDPYGKVAIYNAAWTNARTSSKYRNVILYTGRELDPETGLYYYRARYYDPDLARFLGRDPMGYADELNFYRYVHDRPVNVVDPLGLFTVKDMEYACFGVGTVYICWVSAGTCTCSLREPTTVTERIFFNLQFSVVIEACCWDVGQKTANGYYAYPYGQPRHMMACVQNWLRSNPNFGARVSCSCK